jgi:hypothetical protein
MRLGELAAERGRDRGSLVDEWHARADARIAAGQAPDAAERAALADIEGA